MNNKRKMKKKKKKKYNAARYLWLTPVIPAAHEAEIKGITVQSHSTISSSFFLFFVVLDVGLRSLCLVSKYSTT
jgi:hypothetical protein